MSIDGIKNCKRYDKVAMGEALARYLSNIDVIESNIGEYKGSNYVVTGSQLEKNGSVVDILGSIDSSIEITDKFKGEDGLPAISILSRYLDTVDSKEYCNRIMDTYKSINKNKYLVSPFKTNNSCTVVSKNEIEKGTILSVIWGMNKAEQKLKSQVIIKHYGKNGANTERIDFEDYGKKFRLEYIESALKAGDIHREAIKVNRFGMIQPVAFKDKYIELVLDGSHLYLNTNGETYIIGTWNNNNQLIPEEGIEGIVEYKAFNILGENMEYIKKHLRYIAPYKLVDCSTITVE